MSMYPASLTGYFNSDLPTRTPTISAETLKVSLGTSADARVVQETFVMGRGGARDPSEGLDYICPSYAADSSWHPVKVYRGGVRQVFGDGKDCYFWRPPLFNAAVRGKTGLWTCICMSADGQRQLAGASTGSTLAMSVDGGKTWTDIEGSGHNWSGVCMSSDGQFQAAVEDYSGGAYPGFVFVSSDYGVNWVNRAYSGKQWLSISMSSDGRYMAAVAYNDFIFVSSDYGANWAQRGSKKLWSGVCMSADGRYQTAVPAGLSTIWVSSDFGNSWSSVGTVQLYRAVCMSASGQYQTAVVGFGGVGYIYVSSDYGNSWSAKGESLRWTSVSMSSSGEYQTAVSDAADPGGRAYTSTDYGNTWTIADYARHWQGIAMSSDGVIQTAIASADNIYVSDSSGIIRIRFTKTPIDPGEVLATEYLSSSTSVIPM